MKDLLVILFVAALGMLVIMAAMYIASCCDRRRLTALLERICRGDLTAPESYEFINTRIEQLCYPFSIGDVRAIAVASELRRQELTVEPLYPGQAFWGNYYYHIRGCFEGLDGQGLPFVLQREGWLCIECRQMRGHWKSCILQVQRRSQPF